MATESTLDKVHIFPSEESYNTNKGSVGTDDLALVPIETATTSEYGLTKLADDADLLLESKDKSMTVDNAYKLNDFRRMNTTYSVGDKVACVFEYDFYLECIQAGTTSAASLDTQNVTFGQEIEDGTAKWKVKANVRTVNGVEADEDGNINLSDKKMKLEHKGTAENQSDVALTIKNNAVEKDVTIGNWAHSQIVFTDKNNVGIAYIQSIRDVDGTQNLALTLTKFGTTNDHVSITFKLLTDNTGVLYIPTPHNSANGAEAVTAAWIRNNISTLAPAPTIATETEAVKGTNNTKMMTPLRVKQATWGIPTSVFYDTGDTFIAEKNGFFQAHRPSNNAGTIFVNGQAWTNPNNYSTGFVPFKKGDKITTTGLTRQRYFYTE